MQKRLSERASERRIYSARVRGETPPHNGGDVPKGQKGRAALAVRGKERICERVVPPVSEDPALPVRAKGVWGETASLRAGRSPHYKMVEKIDKPEPPPAYFVQATTETKKDKGGGGQAGPQSDEYSGSHAAPGWQRIYSSAANRRYLKIRREDVMRAWFRDTLMQRGISLVEVDLEIKGGRLLKGAHIILTTREDFWTLKKFQPGQEVPLNMFIRDTILEISVPAPSVQHEPSRQVAGAKQATTAEKKIDSKTMFIYGAIGFAVLLLIIFAVTR